VGPRIAKRIERFLLGDVSLFIQLNRIFNMDVKSPDAIAAAEARENAIITLREATGVGFVLMSVSLVS
jgi:hypothetical protein